MYGRITGLALFAALAAPQIAPAQTVAKVGDVMKYSFSQPLVNGQGIKSLAELQGRPVLVEFWGTH